MVKIVCVNGHPGCGKSTFEDLMIEQYPGRVYKYSTIDIIKDAAVVLGWDGTKTPENRKFLSDLKDLATKWNDVSFKAVLKEQARIQAVLDQYAMPDDYLALLLVDVREPEELAKFAAAGAYTLKIVRNEVDNNTQSNHADADVDNYDYDFEIENNGPIPVLKRCALSFYEVVKNLIKQENCDIIKERGEDNESDI